MKLDFAETWQWHYQHARSRLEEILEEKEIKIEPSPGLEERLMKEVGLVEEHYLVSVIRNNKADSLIECLSQGITNMQPSVVLSPLGGRREVESRLKKVGISEVDFIQEFPEWIEIKNFAHWYELYWQAIRLISSLREIGSVFKPDLIKTEELKVIVEAGAKVRLVLSKFQDKYRERLYEMWDYLSEKR